MHFLQSISSQAASAFHLLTGRDSLSTLSHTALKVKKAALDRAFWVTAGLGSISMAIGCKLISWETDPATGACRGNPWIVAAGTVTLSCALFSEILDKESARIELALRAETLPLESLLRWDLLGGLSLEALQAKFAEEKAADPGYFFEKMEEHFPLFLRLQIMAPADCQFTAYGLSVRNLTPSTASSYFPVRKDRFKREEFEALSRQAQRESERQQAQYEKVLKASRSCGRGKR